MIVTKTNSTLYPNRVTFFGSFVFFMLLFFSCSKPSSTAGNISVTDTQGNTLTIEKPVQKVVILYEPLLETAYMLGVQKTIVGIPSKTYTDAENFKAFSMLDERIAQKKIQTPGDMESANIESIVALQPDLVIAYQLSPAIISSLKEMGIAVYMGKSETYADIKKEITDLSLLFGVEDRGKELLAYAQKEFDAMAEKVKNIPQKSAYFSWANGRIFTTTGQTSMMHECLVFAGVKNVCTSKIDQANINPEILAAWNPDVIFMWNDSPQLFYENSQLSSVTAIKEKKIFTLMPMFYYNPHTLKALLTALSMQTWVYQTHTEQELKTKCEEYLLKLYGKEIGTRLNDAR